MTPSRRQALRGLGLLGTGALAGCLDGGLDGVVGPETRRVSARIGVEHGHEEDGFGRELALSDDGSTALVGAPWADPTAENAGEAYVFERNDDRWTARSRLVVESGDRQDRFGYSVAISGDGSTALLGALWADAPNGSRGGTAYTFERDGGSWSPLAELSRDGAVEGDRFGDSVAMTQDGSTALVGAPGNNHPETRNPGSVHVFERAGSGWGERATLRPADRDTAEGFGESVALSSDGSVALIGAIGHLRTAEPADVAYVFERTGSSWTQGARLRPATGEPSNFYGESVAVSHDGSTLFVGAPAVESGPGRITGATYVYGRDGDWGRQAKLTAADEQDGMVFGSALATARDGSALVVGAPATDDAGATRGSVHVFERGDGSWTERRRLVAGAGERLTKFGVSVSTSADGSITLIGAGEGEHGAGSSSVYLFGPPNRGESNA